MRLRIDPQSSWGSRLVRFGSWLVRVFLTSLGRTYRMRVTEGAEHLDALIESGGPAVLGFWHNRIPIAAGFFYYRVLFRGLKVGALISQSRDGELLSQMVEQWGVAVIRGSSTRGGREALRTLNRAVVQDGISPILIPDGPKGPVYRLKAGAAVLAQSSGAPFVPIGMAARRFSTIKSWDRLIVPWPFSRVAVTIGEPQFLPRSLGTEEIGTEIKRLETLLTDLTRRAEAELGVTDPLQESPPPR